MQARDNSQRSPSRRLGSLGPASVHEMESTFIYRPASTLLSSLGLAGWQIRCRTFEPSQCLSPVRICDKCLRKVSLPLSIFDHSIWNRLQYKPGWNFSSLQTWDHYSGEAQKGLKAPEILSIRRGR